MKTVGVSKSCKKQSAELRLSRNSEPENEGHSTHRNVLFVLVYWKAQMISSNISKLALVVKGRSTQVFAY